MKTKAAVLWGVGDKWQVEEVTLDPPYDLITAGGSLHWMDWSAVLPRFAAALEPGAFLAIVDRHEHEPPWREAFKPVYRRYSTNQDWRPYDLVQELESRGLFRKVGKWESDPVPFAQQVEDYIEALHSMSGFARERMDQGAASAFDGAARAILLAHADTGGKLHMSIVGAIEWGTPLAGS